jgi:hypothetical protein
MKRPLRVRLVALKSDNPWLPEDAGARPGVVVHGLVPTPIGLVERALPNLLRALVHRLQNEGLVDDDGFEKDA